MNRVAIVDAVRTPFVKANTAYAKKSSFELAQSLMDGFIARRPDLGSLVDEVVFGSVLLEPRIPNFGRELVIRTGLPDSITGHFVSNNCISGLLAAANVADGIASGRIKAGIAGGVESMSTPALLFSNKAAALFFELNRAKTFAQRLSILSQFRPNHLKPEAPSPKEPSTGLTMGEHCELMAKEWGITRQRQDRIAFLSHRRAAAAKAHGVLAEEIITTFGISEDNILRADTTEEKLASLKPVFDRSGLGTITAGNASPLTDGASAVLLVSEKIARERGLPILGFLQRIVFSSIHPHDGLLMAPAIALPTLLKETNLTINEIDRFEVHEAFGAQVAANLDAWERGWSKYPAAAPIGVIPEEKMNVNGGSIALGHPFAATGGRIIGSLARLLQREKLQRGVISICAAGAGAGAALITRE